MDLCLAGFVAAIRVTSLLGMGMLRNTFVTSVCRFTMLHSPAAMQLKNAHAFRALLVVADENGNHMHVSNISFKAVETMRLQVCVCYCCDSHMHRFVCIHMILELYWFGI